jgi:hypothetical protein
MTADHTAESVLPDPRYEPCSTDTIKVRVERASNLPPVEADAKLLDISQYGAKLLVPSCLQVHESVVLRIEIAGLQQDFSLPAIVRWRQPVGDAAWRLGCFFTGELPADILCELVLLGYIERRRERRQTIDVGARARWELADDDFPVRIVSISVGGLCISCAQEGTIGDRLVVQLGDGDAEPALIHARAVWQRVTDGRRLIGCTLASRVDYELLCSALRLSPADGCSDAGFSRRRAMLGLGLLIAVIAVAVISLGMYFLWR